MRIAVIVPVLNQFQKLTEALESLKSHHTWQPYIIPNWRENNSCSASWNKGVDMALKDNCDYIAIINDDILFSPWTIDGLINHLEKRRECILVGGNNKNGELADPHDIYNYRRPSVESISPNPDFSCFMVRPDIFDKIGSFDENFQPAYFEDNDFHYRIELAGFVAESTTMAPYFHYGSSTQNSVDGGIVPGDLFLKNQAYFVRKWGDSPGREIFTKPFNNSKMTYKDW